MKYLISMSSVRRYKDTVNRLGLNQEDTYYIPEYHINRFEIRENLRGFVRQQLVLIGDFLFEEYNYLYSNKNDLFEISQLRWEGDHATKQKL